MATQSDRRSHGSQLPQVLDRDAGPVVRQGRCEQVGMNRGETASAPTPGVPEKVSLLFLCYTPELASLLLRLRQRWQ
jgi:hypothetical protein